MKTKLSLIAVLISQVTTTDCMFMTTRMVLPHVRTAVATVRPIAREALHKAKPVFEKVKEHAQPTLEKGVAWAKENPKQALGAGVGIVVGYKTSGDGVIDTTVGMATGACTGLFLTGAQTIKYTVILENQMAMAAARESVLKSELAVSKAGASVLEGQVVNLKNRVITLKQAARATRATTAAFKHNAITLEKALALAKRNAQKQPKVIIQTPAPTEPALSWVSLNELIQAGKNRLAGLTFNLSHA